MMKKGALLLLLLFVSATVPGCRTVQPWERGTLSLEPMQLDDCATHRFEHNTETYREGAMGVAGGKSAGGCGCS